MDENRDNRVERDIVDVTDEHIENERRSEPRMEEMPVENRVAAEPVREELAPLFEDSESKTFRTQWLNIQSRFVDDPREAVKQADELVASVLKSVSMGFSERRVSLEQQWNSGENNVSTEDLRVALKRYRSFFDRLLSLES
jgi:hypothetical protein